MRFFKKISLIFLITLVLLIGTITALLTTSSGIRFVINKATDFVEGLDIGQVEGNLKDLTLSDVRFVMPGVDVNVGELKLAIGFSCLKSSKICVEQLASKDANIHVDTTKLPPSEANPNAAPLTELITPYPIELHSLTLDNSQVNVDGMAISLAQFSTAATWKARKVTLKPTQINSLSISLPASTQAEKVETVKTDDKPLGPMLEALFAKPLLKSLPEVIIPVDLVIEEINGNNWQLVSNGEINIIDNLLIKANTQESNVNIETFKVSAPQGTVALIGDASLNKNWPVSLTLNSALNMPDLRGERVKVQLAGEVVGELKLAVNVSGPVSAQLLVETSLAQAELPLSVTFESKKIQWPITGTPDYRADNVRLRLTGKATGYVLSLRSDLSGKDLPPANMVFDGKGNAQRFNISRLRLSALDGKAEVSGVADWSKAISWNMSLLIDGINTVKQWPEWPATLQGKAVTKGSVYGGSWQLSVPELNLTGNVKEQPLNIVGNDLSGNAAGQWKIPNLSLALGHNRFDAKGELMKDWYLDATLNAPNLNNTLPGLRGVAKGAFKLRGTAKAPALTADLHATGLRWQDLSIASIKLNSDVLSAQQISGNLNLVIERLIMGETRMNQITLTGQGNENNHQLVLKANGKPASADLTLTGRFDRKTETWQGSLGKLLFKTPLGDWRLSNDIPLEYRNKTQMATIGVHCWLNQDAEICLPKAAQVGASGDAFVQIKRLDVAILREVLKGTGLEGQVTGEADIQWNNSGQMPQVKAFLKGDNVKITERLNGRQLPIAFDDIRVNANVNSQHVKLDWLLKLTGNGKFGGNLQITEPQTSRRQSGTIDFDQISLAILQPALSSREKASGMLDGQLRLSGTSKAPLVMGSLDLAQVVLDANWSPVTITEGQVKLKFNGTSSVLNGQIKTRRGDLAIDGHADWRNPNAWFAKVAAKGQRVRIEMPPMVQLDISPDVVVEARPDQLKLDGSVEIPWAKIVVDEVPASAVGISSDEVILNTDLQPMAPKQTSIPIVSNLAIKIGPNVALDAFGLKATLGGDLKMTQDTKGLGLHGRVSLLSGSFRAYGQDLLINEGLIIFVGPPDQPQLNIDAIRNPDATEDGVTAGLKVTGFADRPVLTIYSDPAMSQEQALSYLLRGQSLESGSDDNTMMTTMLVSLGVAQSGKLVGKIGETFGIKDLSLDTQGVGDSSQVVVSGYILPRLQVKYGIGLFDSLATLTLRYRLMPRLYLEAVSGLDQALDVLYQFKF